MKILKPNQAKYLGFDEEIKNTKSVRDSDSGDESILKKKLRSRTHFWNSKFNESIVAFVENHHSKKIFATLGSTNRMWFVHPLHLKDVLYRYAYDLTILTRGRFPSTLKGIKLVWGRIGKGSASKTEKNWIGKHKKPTAES